MNESSNGAPLISLTPLVLVVEYFARLSVLGASKGRQLIDRVYFSQLIGRATHQSAPGPHPTVSCIHVATDLQTLELKDNPRCDPRATMNDLACSRT